MRYDEIASIKKNLNKKILSRKKEFQTNIKTKLPEVILDSSASDIIPYMFNVPNFITNYRVRKSIKYINASNIKQDLKNKIVLIENADPGFDWLFSKKKGLITQYGGVNSHMAIRCAELNIPAAIGCGEKKFDEIKKAKFVELDCALNTITNKLIIKKKIPGLLWITGLSGSGKTTISLMLKKKLSKKYSNIVLLDGDVLRNKFKIKKLFFLQK